MNVETGEVKNILIKNGKAQLEGGMGNEWAEIPEKLLPLMRKLLKGNSEGWITLEAKNDLTKWAEQERQKNCRSCTKEEINKMMTTLIILIGALLFFVFFLVDYYDRPVVLFCLFIWALVAILHFALLINSKIEYKSFVVQRTAFVQSLNQARADGYSIESAAILNKTADYNEALALHKYSTTLGVVGIYTDKRFNNLKPIK